jgi:hypothetical protein
MSHSPRRPPDPPEGPEPPAVTLRDLAEARALYAQLDPAWFDEANDPQGWLLDPEVQGLIAEAVEEETAPFAPLLRPEELQILRHEVELACHVDPLAIEYLDRLRSRAPQDASGKTRKGMFDAPSPAHRSAKKVGGGRS